MATLPEITQKCLDGKLCGNIEKLEHALVNGTPPSETGASFRMLAAMSHKHRVLHAKRDLGKARNGDHTAAINLARYCVLNHVDPNEIEESLTMEAIEKIFTEVCGLQPADGEPAKASD